MGFKKGDLLVCVDACGGLTKGNSYTVASNDRDESLLSPSVIVTNDYGNEQGFFSRRFTTPAGSAPTTKPTLPTDSKERKDYPLHSGLLRYFPAALAGVARTSKLGNDKHNPGEEIHHARGKSMDHGDCILRHLTDVEDLLAAIERGDMKVTDQDVLNEVNQMAWRALALSQELHEKFGAPLAPGAKV